MNSKSLDSLTSEESKSLKESVIELRRSYNEVVAMRQALQYKFNGNFVDSEQTLNFYRYFQGLKHRQIPK